MTIDREREIGRCHTATVVGDADFSSATAIGEDIDPAGAGIDGVFHQLLHHARRTLDHFAGSDAVDELFRELTDGHGFQSSETEGFTLGAFGLFGEAGDGPNQRLSPALPAVHAQGLHQSSYRAAPRFAFTSPRRFLPSSRRCFDPSVGLVGRLGVGRITASRINSTSRSMASARLRSWVRKRCAWITITPSLVMRW